MGIKRIFFVLSVILISNATLVYSQKSGSNFIKVTTRNIVLYDINNPEVKKHGEEYSQDKQVAEMIIDDVKAGKLKAYVIKDLDDYYKFSRDEFEQNKLSVNHLVDILNPITDTFIFFNSNTKTEERKVIRLDFQPYDVICYKILEVWTYNPLSDNIEVKIKAIAPMKEDYGNDGTYRGRHALFWVKYEEISKIIQRYEQFHPHFSLVSSIWDTVLLGGNELEEMPKLQENSGKKQLTPKAVKKRTK